MDRTPKIRYIPQCPRNIGIVDQYMWPQKDTNKYMCYNGISHPIYDCQGMINFTLPLEMYPPDGDVHPQIKLINRMQLNYRQPYIFREPLQEGYDNMSDGMYTEGAFAAMSKRMPTRANGRPIWSESNSPERSRPEFVEQNGYLNGYPLPSPNGETQSTIGRMRAQGQDYEKQGCFY